VSKFSVTVSKKLYKTAVLRNRAKRRVFAILRDISPTKPGYYEFFLKSPIESTSFEELNKEIKNILCRNS
jgi:ribonuclease P protein component